MRISRLELMLYGRELTGVTATVQCAGVRILQATTSNNPNYLFLALDVAADVQAGVVNILLTGPQGSLQFPYELRKRCQRPQRSVDARDVILNLVPDRFANGNPSIDNLPDYPDRMNRQDIAGGRHGGDLPGMIGQLDYIVEMGYTVLWPTPLVESNQDRYSYHGYATTDTYRVDPRFGSNEDYRRLAEVAGAKGIGIIHDIVLNHIGSQHWWMDDLPAQDWITNGGQYLPNGHACTTVNDPYASLADKKNYVTGWFDRCMPDLNHRNPQLATYQIQNAIWWVEYIGLAGLRVDTYGYSDQDFLAQWSGRLAEEYPQLAIIGEVMSFNPVSIAYWLRGQINPNGYVSHLPSVMDYPLSHTLRTALTTEDIPFPASGLFLLYEALVNDTLYPDPMRLVVFEGNHDLPRIFSLLNEDYGLYQIALAYLLTTRGIPQLYYGTEILMTSPTVRDDGAFRQDFPGGWHGDRISASTGEGLGAQQQRAQAFVRRLLHWRMRSRAIHRGKLLHFAPVDGSYVYFRHDNDQMVMVVLNKSMLLQTLDTTHFREILPAGAAGVDAITGTHFDLNATLLVPPRSALILDITTESQAG